MGNCQAVDAAALVIQHPNGKVERMYWPVTANHIMKLNPGHYVSLIIPLPLSENDSAATTTTTATATATATAATTTATDQKKKTVRYTRVKLLRPSDTLVLGRAYRLVTSQEVKKVLRAKKLANTKTSEEEPAGHRLKTSQGKEKREGERPESERNDQVSKQERQKLRSGSMNSRSKTWRPSLQSISEAGS